MLEIALCDDDKVELDVWQNMIRRYCKENKIQFIISLFHSGYELLHSFKMFHVIFLDIKMDEIDGIQTAKEIRLRDKHVKIVYITNYTNFRNEAFNVRAFGYIVKPITYNQICQNLDDIISYSIEEHKKNNVTFDTDQGIKTVDIKDIYYFESYDRKAHIYCIDGNYLISDNLKDIINKFKFFGFSMPHKSYVINMHYISYIRGYNVILTKGQVIPISQKRAVEFKTEFHNYLKNNFNLFIKR